MTVCHPQHSLVLVWNLLLTYMCEIPQDQQQWKDIYMNLSDVCKYKFEVQFNSEENIAQLQSYGEI